MRTYNPNNTKEIIVAASRIKPGSFVKRPSGKVEYILLSRTDIRGEGMQKWPRIREVSRATKKGKKMSPNGRRIFPVKGYLHLNSRDSGCISHVPLDMPLRVPVDCVI